MLWLGFVFFGLHFGHPQSEFCILKQYSTISVQACLSQLTLQEEQLRFTFYSLNYLLFISASVKTETNQNYRSSKLRWLDLNPQTLSVKRSQ